MDYIDYIIHMKEVGDPLGTVEIILSLMICLVIAFLYLLRISPCVRFGDLLDLIGTPWFRAIQPIQLSPECTEQH